MSLGGDVSSENALLVAVSIAAQDAGARIQAATITAEAAATAEIAVANITSTAQTGIANIEANTRVAVASAQGNFEVQVANISANAQTSVATTEAGARVTVATTEAGAQTSVASTNAQAEIAAAQAHADAVISAAVSQANATTAAAEIDSAARQSVATISSQAQVSAATIDAGARTTAASTEADATKYSADQQLSGINIHESAETGRLNARLAFAEDKWNSLLPTINEAFGGSSSGGSSGGLGFHASARPGPTMGFGAYMDSRISTASLADEGYPEFQVGHYSRKATSPLFGPARMGSGDVKTGGIGFSTGASVADATAATQLPFLSTTGVLTPAQIQQQVNAAYARNDAKTASEFARISQIMSGRGFSSNSPILNALQVGLSGQNLRASLQTETQIRLDSAKLNADALTTRQKNLSDQFIQQEQVLVDSARNDVTRTVGVLSAVSQLIGSAL